MVKFKKMFIKDKDLCEYCHQNKKEYIITIEKPLTDVSNELLFIINICHDCKETYITLLRNKQNEKIYNS